MYDRLFVAENPEADEDKNFKEFLNPNSLEVIENAKIEPFIKGSKPGDKFQFERLGYFVVDRDSIENKLVFNRTVTLRDTWAKIERKG